MREFLLDLNNFGKFILSHFIHLGLFYFEITILFVEVYFINIILSEILLYLILRVILLFFMCEIGLLLLLGHYN